MKIACLVLALLTFPAAQATAQPAQDRAYAIPPIDAPELAALGPHQVGVQQLQIISPAQVSLTAAGVVRADRAIKAKVWYPAAIGPDARRTDFTHVLPRPDGKGAEFTIASLAVMDAPAAPGHRYPLVIVSHGYNGWDTFMTWLTENLATKGYVVVAIDHADQRAVNPAQLPVSFGNVLTHRAADVRAVINYFAARAADPGDALGQTIDAENIGLVGYSMGGFGVLGAAGMDYNLEGPVFSQLPTEVRDSVVRSQVGGQAVAARVKAVVALAPFGGRPESRVWTSETIAAFTKPVLMIDGDHDDIVDAKEGVTWIFDQMARNSRHFLLYQNARHNVGGNPPPPEAETDFSTREYFADAVWRADRINSINQHFITAFMDLHLKGDRAKTDYLDVTPPLAGDGQWPLEAFANVGGRPASEQQPEFWRGFQRRWAIGLEMKTGEPQPAD